jgi:outer membrane protein TolC
MQVAGASDNAKESGRDRSPARVCIWLGLVVLLVTCTRSMRADQKYENLTLDDCINIAFDNNIGYKNAKENLKISESSYRVSKSAYYPTGTLTAETSKNKLLDTGTIQKNKSLGIGVTQPVITGGSLSANANTDRTEVAGDETYLTDTTVSFTQPLLKGIWGTSVEETFKGRQILDEQIRIERKLQDEKLSMVFSVTSSYYGLLGLKRSIDIAKSAVDEAELFLKVAKIKKQEGLVAKIDVTRAELQVAQTKARLVTARRNYELSRDAFLNLLGLSFSEPIILADKIEFKPQDVMKDKYMAAAFDNRLDYRLAQLTVETGKIAVNIARKNILPELDLNVNYSAEGLGTTFDESSDFFDPSLTTGLSLVIPWGDIGRRENYRQAVERLIISRNNLQDKKRQIILETSQAIVGVQEAQESLEIQGASVKLAKEGLDLATRSYQEEIISNIDLLKAQDDYTNVNNSYINALIQCKVAYAKLDRVVAKEWVPAVTESEQGKAIPHEKVEGAGRPGGDTHSVVDGGQQFEQ